jgi:hypothetical protein
METLAAALRLFEATEANLAKLERLWDELRALIPEGIAFGSPGQYEELCLAFRQILSALPAIDGFKLTDAICTYDSIGQMRFDAAELGDIDATVTTESCIFEQGRLLQEYRFKFQAKRRALVRNRMLALVDSVDDFLRSILAERDAEPAHAAVADDSWQQLRDAVSEIDTLLGSGARPSRWADLQRHLHFGMQQDLQDIQRLDWPSVKAGLVQDLYGQHDPIPVDVQDLGEVVASKPGGAVPTKLDWSALSDEDFERLLFVLISETAGYENPEWLQHTNAVDRGRDLSAVRVEADPLLGVKRHRTIIQCKHWLNKSVSATDVGNLRTQMALWEPPRVDSLIIATSGRFSTDAVDLVEKHNQTDHALRISLWPESHLERLLAARPHLIAQFRLRRS